MAVSPEWSHLTPLVDALCAAGNAVLRGGFEPSQGGLDCYLAHPIDYEIVDTFVATVPHDIRVARERQEVACLHCWASIHGGSA